MRFVKQPLSLPVENIDEKLQHQKGPEIRRHGPLLPKSIRAIVCGPSSCGKTNVLISLIENPNGLRFENVYIFSKTLHQDKYKYLESILKPIKGLGFYTFSSNEQVIAPSKAKPNSIVIFDDVISEKQPQIASYFTLGRHHGLDSFYLSQTYTRVPKHLIRDNVNFLIVFRQDDLNLKHIFSDFGIGCDMKFDEFRNMCQQCWKEKHGFVCIDVDNDVKNGKYRRGFDQFLQL